MDCRAEIDLKRITPAVTNDPSLASRVRKAAGQVLPEIDPDTTYRTMGSEDMAYLMQSVPGCYFFVGTGNPDGVSSYPHHHPRFDIDEQALPRAAALMSAAAAELLRGL
jgi:amidohydrolase